MKSARNSEIWFWKFFFEHTFQIWVFSLFVVYMREIRGSIAPIDWYTFSRTTSYFLRKCQKKPFSSNLSYLAQKRSTQCFKKEIKTIKTELNYYFLNLKILILPKVTRVWSWMSKRHKNAQIAEIGSTDLFFMSFRRSTSNASNFWRIQPYLIFKKRTWSFLLS